MRPVYILSASLLCTATFVTAQVHDYPRDLFDTVEPSTGATPFPNYDPARLAQLFKRRETEIQPDKRRGIDFQMFDVINEAAVRHDPSLKDYLKLYGKDLGYVPLLAVAHYKWVFGDKSQLDWLLAEDKKSGIGRDSLILTVFGYMDEWDKTIHWLKQNAEFEDKHSPEGAGAAGEVLYRAIEIRKGLYGADRFERAWKAAKIK